MMKKTILYSLLLSAICLISCSKESRLRNKYAGPKTISRYQLFIADSVSQEFTKKIYDIDTMGDILLWDNNSDLYNNTTLYLKVAPTSWGVNGVGGEVGWYCDWAEGKSFTFFSEFVKGRILSVTYTIKSNIGGKMTLECVFPLGKNIYKEIIELKKTGEN